mmetsp:Transcript_58706/g.135356  ORF Transcript_58706/g.135356 Transcript_58706/m.135356 type:complete len:224 (-) Transcript_58706:637-1308(-)
MDGHFWTFGCAALCSRSRIQSVFTSFAGVFPWQTGRPFWKQLFRTLGAPHLYQPSAFVLPFTACTSNSLLGNARASPTHLNPSLKKNHLQPPAQTSGHSRIDAGGGCRGGACCSLANLIFDGTAANHRLPSRRRSLVLPMLSPSWSDSKHVFIIMVRLTTMSPMLASPMASSSASTIAMHSLPLTLKHVFSSQTIRPSCPGLVENAASISRVPSEYANARGVA